MMRSEYSKRPAVFADAGKEPCGGVWAAARSSIGQVNVTRIMLLLVGAALVFYIYDASLPLACRGGGGYFGISSLNSSSLWSDMKPVSELERVLMAASMENKTVIITALNQAWAEPNSTFDVFLESFRIGLGTQKLLQHVVAACLDAKAFERCNLVHKHCYLINATGTDGEDLSHANTFMTKGYLKLIWRRMNFLREVLDLGYSFIFTDADIVWLRDPFPRLFPDADFQIASDTYSGNATDKRNRVNSGFTYVKSSNRMSLFYKYWCDSSRRFPNMHDQDVFNAIKSDPNVTEIGIQMKFLDTVYFGGFCQPSKDINVVCTMHANCCKGLWNKVNDLKIVLDVWRRYVAENVTAAETKWNAPAKCHC